MSNSRILRGLMLAMVAALLLPGVALADKGVPGGGVGPAAVGHVTISGDPLTIHVAIDTSIQVYYAGEPDGQVFPPGYDEADSGAFAHIGRQVFGPDFGNHDLSAANMVTVWVPVSQTGPTGAGTSGNPWEVVTTVSCTQGMVVLIQTVRYVDGHDFFEVYYTVNNLSQMPVDVSLFHALDLYVGGDDDTYGLYDAASGAVGGWNLDRDFSETISGIVSGTVTLPPDFYQEAFYADIWDNIGTDPITPGPGFNDTIRAYPDWHDGGCGLQWNLSIPPGDFREVGLDWSFYREEAPPPPPPPPPPPEEEFVPEPGSVVLLASGLLGLAGYAGLRLRKR